jgi:hypothetical protein
MFGFWFLVRLRFALRGLALCRVCEVPSFVSGWRAFSSFSLCKYERLAGIKRKAAEFGLRAANRSLANRELLYLDG